MYARLLNMIKARKTVFTLVALLAAFVCVDMAYYFGVYRPVAVEVSALKDQAARLVQSERETAAAVAAYEHFVEGMKSLGEFKSRIASRTEYADVIKNVYTLARKDGMRGSSFGAQTSEVRQVGGIEEISFNMPVSGSYKGVRKFIYDVENSDMLLNINRLGLTGGDDGEITLTIALSTYVRL